MIIRQRDEYYYLKLIIFWDCLPMYCLYMYNNLIMGLACEYVARKSILITRAPFRGRSRCGFSAVTVGGACKKKKIENVLDHLESPGWLKKQKRAGNVRGKIKYLIKVQTAKRRKILFSALALQVCRLRFNFVGYPRELIVRYKNFMRIRHVFFSNLSRLQFD